MGDGDHTFGPQYEALIRQQAVLILMDQAINALAAIYEVQERQEQGLAELMDSVTAALRDEPMLTATELTRRLDVDPDELDQAIMAALDVYPYMDQSRPVRDG